MKTGAQRFPPSNQAAPAQVVTAAKQFVERIPLKCIAPITLLQDHVGAVESLMTPCQVQFVEAGIAYALISLRASSTDSASKITMKQILLDMRNSVFKEAHGISEKLIQPLLYKAAKEHT